MLSWRTTPNTPIHHACIIHINYTSIHAYNGYIDLSFFSSEKFVILFQKWNKITSAHVIGSLESLHYHIFAVSYSHNESPNCPNQKNTLSLTAKKVLCANINNNIQHRLYGYHNPDKK